MGKKDQPTRNKSGDPIRSQMKVRLRAKGLRATRPRLAVLAQLHRLGRPLSNPELMASLGTSAFDRASVYRILSDLAEAGLLRRMDLGDKVWRYELLSLTEEASHDHAHFLCVACNRVTCLPEIELRPVSGGALPPELTGAVLHLRVTGRCGECPAA